MEAICVQNAVKQYKNGVQALNGLTLSVKAGEIFSLLGPNGAGKSTIIGILTTYAKPTSGQFTMLGKDLYKDAASIRRKIACVAQQTSIDTYLSLEENMMFQSRLYQIPKAEATSRMQKLIADFGLKQYQKYPVSSYSGGVKRRLDIALNMMTNPQILFLDEPTVGMDLQSRTLMWKMMKKIRDDFGTTIFLTTHYLEEADNLSDTVCIMRDGREIVQGTPLALRSYMRQDSIQILFAAQAEAEAALLPLQSFYAQEKIFMQDTMLVFQTQDSRHRLEQTTQFLLEQHIPFTGIQIAQPTLEDVFLRLTTEQKQEALL